MYRRKAIGIFSLLLLALFSLQLAAQVEAAFSTNYPDDPAGRVPLIVSFTDESTGNPTSWLWDFGDGTTSTEQNPQHVYVDLGFYDVSLTVALDDDEDTLDEHDYVTVYGIDMMHVLDQSYSMQGQKLNSLVSAAGTFNSLLDTHSTLGDEAGVVSYESREHLKYGIGIMQSGSTLSAMQSTISSMQAGGTTALYRGVELGCTQVTYSADSNDPDFQNAAKPAGLLVMSDGLNNSSNAGNLTHLSNYTVVHALGFGADCNPSILIALANATGGSYHFASTGNIPVIMSDIYQALKAGQRTVDYEDVLLEPSTDLTYDFYLDETCRNATVNLDWFEETTEMTLTLISPSNKIYDYSPLQNDYKVVHTPTQRAYKIYNPEPGTWQAVIHAEKQTQEPDTFFFWALSASSLELDLGFAASDLMPGDPLIIESSLSNTGEVPQHEITYTIEHPDGHIVTLSGDDSAQAGSIVYRDTNIPGNYTITATATGTGDVRFQRIVREAVWVNNGEEPLDTDEVPEPVTAYSISNAPNPFNPETKISYSLPANTHVTITVYNMLGQKVTTLVNKNMEKGNHSVVWSGKDNQNRTVGSGVYLYRIETDDYQQTKRMLMLK